ncbi:hypothetical protein QFC19_003600 [Naganishia cerealis]|uniref:Uncharacterized protein n=1 Tax=Naganishia cerealis TaxID=610337 RepID=A0ACC2W0K9_9TREE|nr:hypothetical protein QFC19_003600 [Naganishia cerealis]
MTSPSMQFAPAWLKKPSGTSSAGSATSGGHPANSTLAFSQAVASAPTIGNLQHSLGTEENSGLSGVPSSGIKQTGTPNPLGQSYSQIASPRNEFSSYPNHGLSSAITSASVHLSTAIDGSSPAGDNKARPFRYSREVMLALFEEEKVRERPLELMEWAMHPNNSSGHVGAEQGGIASIILSDKAGIPMGLVEWTTEEKKLFANPIRRQPAHPDRSESSLSTTLSSRRNGHLAGTGETRSPGGRGFGRGEGGAFGGVSGGTRYTPSGAPAATPDYIAAGNEDRRAAGGAGTGERLPWTPGVKLRDPTPASDSAFGAGRGERTGLIGERRSLRGTARREVPEAGAVDASPRPPAAAIGGQGSWRPNIRSTPSAGSFEGVLGFSGTTVNKPQGEATTEGTTAPSAANGWRDRNDGSNNGAVPSPSGGPSWGKGRWRAAALEREATDRDTSEKRPALAALVKGNSAENPQPSESTVVIPPATPVEQRDQQVSYEDISAQAGTAPSVPAPAAPSGEADPRSIKWFYTDPSGQQQGPFEATNMQTWFAANYFNDTLPLRREHETSYRTLAALKEETASMKEPFLSPSVPKFPPNLPIPSRVHSQSEHTSRQGLDAGMSDMISSLPQTASPHLASGQQTPHRNENLFSTASPAFGQANINRSTDPFSGTASYHSSPVVQNGIPVRTAWDNAVASPAISRPAFGGNFQQEIPQIQHQQSYGGFPPQPQFGQPRSLFDAPQVQSPFAPVPAPVQSPWASQGAGHPQQMLPGQNFVSSPFHQPMQSPYHQYAGPVPSMMPWQGTPTPQSAAVQPHQQQAYQPSFASMPPAPNQASPLMANEQPSIAESLLSPVQSQGVPQHDAISNETVVGESQVEPAAAPQDGPVTQEVIPNVPEVEVQPEVVAPVHIASPVLVPAVKETKTKVKAKKLAKPAPAVEKQEVVEAVPEPEVQTVQSDLIAGSPAGATPSVAPWASKDEEKVKVQTGPSLRDIQEAEAKAAEARKHEAKAKATASKAATANTVVDPETTQTVSWGLPSRTGGAGSSATSVPAPAASPAPVWGSSDAAPKKTLKQIQEEEQRRAKAAAQAKVAASPAAAAQQGKRGYADLAATQASQPTSGGVWSTVGASGKAVGAPVPAPATKSKSTSTPSMTVTPVKPASTISKTAKSASLDDIAPSVEFIRWCKEALKGLKVNMDEFIQMLLTFPVEPGASGRADLLEIISDSVYANSSTLDGRRFAQEFYTKRKADAQNRLANGSQAPSKINSLADIVKTQPKAATSDFGGFKVVKAKGKGRK